MAYEVLSKELFHPLAQASRLFLVIVDFVFVIVLESFRFVLDGKGFTLDTVGPLDNKRLVALLCGRCLELVEVVLTFVDLNDDVFVVEAADVYLAWGEVSK